MTKKYISVFSDKSFTNQVRLDLDYCIFLDDDSDDDVEDVEEEKEEEKRPFDDGRAAAAHALPMMSRERPELAARPAAAKRVRFLLPRSDSELAARPAARRDKKKQKKKKNGARYKQQVKRKQQYLLLLRHSAKCRCKGRCPFSPLCGEFQEFWKHMETYMNFCQNKSCGVRHCRRSRVILNHSYFCTNPCCPVCDPVRRNTITLDSL